MEERMLNQRGSGILLHFTSLPSPFGIGDFGPWSYRYADFLAETKQSYWQCLPLNPTDVEYGNSPYHSISAFAFNPLLISPELLIQEGALTRAYLEPVPPFSRNRVDFELVVSYKCRLLSLAYQRFKKESANGEFRRFCTLQASWLDDFACSCTSKRSSRAVPGTSGRPH
jgi:4-alpha-glucanotransferase